MSTLTVLLNVFICALILVAVASAFTEPHSAPYKVLCLIVALFVLLDMKGAFRAR